MNRTVAVLIVVTTGCLLVAGHAIAQVFAQPAPGGAPPGAAAPATVAPLAAPASHPGAPGKPRPPAGVAPQGGAFIRAVVPGGGGGGGVVYQAGPGWGGFGGDMGGFGPGPGQDDAEMSKLMQSEHELARQSDDLVRQYGGTEDYAQREKLRTQMRELLGKQFDIQRQRRERELEQVEKRIGKLREQLAKRNSARDTIIDRRLENLTSDAEGLGWTPPAGGGTQGFSGGVYGPPARPPVAR